MLSHASGPRHENAARKVIGLEEKDAPEKHGKRVGNTS